jgi:4-hydroxy-tetrahydrodipicolinate synthase
MIEDFLQGKVEEIARMQQKFLPLFKAMSVNGRVNPAALLKEAMKLVGYNAGIPRLPLTPGTEEEIADIKRIMIDLEILI